MFISCETLESLTILCLQERLLWCCCVTQEERIQGTRDFGTKKKIKTSSPTFGIWNLSLTDSHFYFLCSLLPEWKIILSNFSFKFLVLKSILLSRLYLYEHWALYSTTILIITQILDQPITIQRACLEHPSISQNTKLVHENKPSLCVP